MPVFVVACVASVKPGRHHMTPTATLMLLSPAKSCRLLCGSVRRKSHLVVKTFRTRHCALTSPGGSMQSFNIKSYAARIPVYFPFGNMA